MSLAVRPSRHASSLAVADDETLLVAVRSGDAAAFGELWVRHERAGLAYARSLSGSCADDLVAEAFTKILRTLQAGKGPRDNFRAYLYAAIRTGFIDEYRRFGRTLAVGYPGDLDALVDRQPPAPDGADDQQAQDAWRALSKREQWIMWATAIEGYTTPEIADRLGVRPGTAAVWAHRARQRFQAAFLARCVATTDQPDCQLHRDRFVGYVRGSLSPKRREAVAGHVDSCPDCQQALLSVATVNQRLRAVGWPVLPAAGWLAIRLTSRLARMGHRTAVGHLGGSAASVKAAAAAGSLIAAATVGAVAVHVVAEHHPHPHSPTQVVAEPVIISTGSAPTPAATPTPAAVATTSHPVPSPSVSSIVFTSPSTSRPAPPRSSPSRAAPATPSASASSAAPARFSPPVPSPSPSSTPTPTSSPSTAAPMVTRSASATFAVVVPDPNNVTGTITLALPSGWTATGLTITGLASQGGVTTIFNGDNTVQLSLNDVQVDPASATLSLEFTGTGPFTSGETADATIAIPGVATSQSAVLS